MFGRAAIRLGIGPHSSLKFKTCLRENQLKAYGSPAVLVSDMRMLARLCFQKELVLAKFIVLVHWLRFLT